MKRNVNFRALAETAAMPLLELVLGAVFLLHPDGALGLVFRILGWVMTAVAAVLVIAMVTDRVFRPGQTAIAAVCGIGGLLLVRNPLILAAGAGKLLGALLAVQVLLGILRERKVRGDTARLAPGQLLTLILGIFLLLSPMSPTRLILRVIGIALILGGIIGLFSANRDLPARREPRKPDIIDADE